MRVKAAPGIRFPREDKPRTYIEQDEVEVPESAYYVKAVQDGDLVDVSTVAPAQKAAPAAPAKSGDQANG